MHETSGQSDHEMGMNSKMNKSYYARIVDHESYVHDVFEKTEWYIRLPDA